MPTKIPLRVVHASGQDDSHKVSELNHHHPTTKGWQSSRFCLYPQDLIIQLESHTRIRKIQILSHQTLIASKVEFYVGDVADGSPANLQNARYTRLGYVALSDNEKTGYRARELKSVHVDAIGLYVKFVIHKNHINKHNLYNQVGLIALNVIGEPVQKPHNLSNDDEINDLSEQINLVPYQKPNFISPLDDLAFDMYQDPEVAQIIRKLDTKKARAVADEHFQQAQQFKDVIAELQKVGEKLGKMDVEKRQAVESEDYSQAEQKRLEMDEFRLNAYKEYRVHELLSSSPQRINPPAQNKAKEPDPFLNKSSSPVYSPAPPETSRHQPETFTSNPNDERPLPAIKRLAAEENDQADLDADARGSAVPLDVGDSSSEPEPMTEQDQREASVAIEAFGYNLVNKAYSKTWSFREDSLLEVFKVLQSLSPSSGEARLNLHGAVFLINRAIKDKVFAVFTAALNLLNFILKDYISKHRLPKNEIVYTVEKTFQSLLVKAGDMASRYRDLSKSFILESSKLPEVKPTHVILTESVKPFNVNLAPRAALSRTEVLEMLYKEHGIQSGGLTIDNVMRFCVNSALKHHAGEVRECAENIIIDLYRTADRNQVRSHLPTDDEKNRRNLIYKKLFVAFDRIDGKPTKEELKKSKQEKDRAKQKEIEALQNQVQQLRDMADGKKPVDQEAIKDDPKSNKKSKKPEKKSRNKADKPAPSKPADDDTNSTFQIDKICIFCGEKNDSFTEEGLDTHYWKSCPMLKRCSFCKQVVEVSGLSEHLLTECDSKTNHRRCNRCTEPITLDEYDQHVQSAECTAVPAKKNHCPLCHQNFNAGEEEWKKHLMGKDGCKNNPRRLAAASQKQATKVSPRTKIPSKR